MTFCIFFSPPGFASIGRAAEVRVQRGGACACVAGVLPDESWGYHPSLHMRHLPAGTYIY